MQHASGAHSPGAPRHMTHVESRTPAHAEDGVDPSTFRRVLGHHATGVCVVTTVSEAGAPVGMTVNSFASASLSPPLVAFFANPQSRTFLAIAASRRFCANMLGADQGDLCRRFAKTSQTKFEGVDYRVSAVGAPILHGAIAWIECSLHSVAEAGDHMLVLGRTRALGVTGAEMPLVAFRGSLGGFATSPDDH